MSKPKPKECGNCPFLVVVERRDFHPHTPSYYCGATPTRYWLGFQDVRPAWCLPVIQPTGGTRKET